MEHIWYLPLAVNTKRLDYLLEDTDFHKYQNEIAFVGSLYEKNSYDNLPIGFPII